MSRTKVQAVFDEAVELTAGERAAFLDAACGGDADLRAEVERLLQFDSNAPADAGDEHFLAGLLFRTGDAAASAPPPAETLDIGHYHVLGEIGRGGMGTVYEAEQDNPRRTVALKVMRPGMDTPDLR